MFGLGGLGTKLLIAGIIIAVVSSAIGGFWLYQKSIINDLNETITEKERVINQQKEQIAGLKLDIQSLKASNASLESEISRKAVETKEAYEEITKLRAVDLQSSARLQELEKRLRDKTNLQRHEAVRNSRKASLLLRLISRDIDCFAENFEKVDGKCVRGKWVPTGERLVPEVPPSEKGKEGTKNE